MRKILYGLAGAWLVFAVISGSRVAAQGEDKPADPCGGEGAFKAGKCEKAFTHAVVAGRPEFSFTVVWAAESAGTKVLDSLEVRDPSRSDFSQVLVFAGKDYLPAAIALEFGDYNFDGSFDLNLLINSGASNEERLLIIYDTANESFVILSRTFWNLSVDKKKQLVYNNMISGCAGNNYDITGFRIEGLNPVPVRGEERKEIVNGCRYFRERLYKFDSGKASVVAERIIEIRDFNGSSPTVLLGPLAPPLTVAPSAAVIRFLSAEENKDAAGMAALYTGSVVWHAERKAKADLEKNHAAYLAGLAAYSFELSDFKQTMNAANTMAVVENKVKASFKINSGKTGAFALIKRFRLVKVQDEWLIDCEEDAEFFDGAKGTVTQACKLSGD